MENEYLISVVGVLIAVLSFIFAISYVDITNKQLHHECVIQAIEKFTAPEVLAVCGSKQ